MSIIKSIQRGVQAATGNVTISSVDTTKAFVSCSFDNGQYSTSFAYAGPSYRTYAYGFGYSVSYKARLTSSTNLEITGGTTTSAGSTKWEVIEYA